MQSKSHRKTAGQISEDLVTGGRRRGKCAPEHPARGGQGGFYLTLCIHWLVLESQLSYKTVNLMFQLVIVKNKLTIFTDYLVVEPKTKEVCYPLKSFVWFSNAPPPLQKWPICSTNDGWTKLRTVNSNSAEGERGVLNPGPPDPTPHAI